MTPWILALLLLLTEFTPNMKWRIILGIGGIPALLVVVLVYYELGLEAESKGQHRKDSFNAEQIQKGDRFVTSSITMKCMCLTNIGVCCLGFVHMQEKIPCQCLCIIERIGESCLGQGGVGKNESIALLMSCIEFVITYGINHQFAALQR